MEVIWSLMLTVCMDSQSCIKQDVQWFESEKECKLSKKLYEEIPQDGHWTTVEYLCKPKGSIGA